MQTLLFDDDQGLIVKYVTDRLDDHDLFTVYQIITVKNGIETIGPTQEVIEKKYFLELIMYDIKQFMDWAVEKSLDLIKYSDESIISIVLVSGSSWTPQKIAGTGRPVAWYNPLAVGGAVRDINGLESIYWDMMIGSNTMGVEQNNGVIILYAVYKITATQANFFYAGCAIGDVFPCGVVKTCDANNKVQRVLGNHLTQPVVASRPINGVLDGVDDFMKTAPFIFIQPETIYLVAKQITWTAGNRIFDGNADNSGAYYQSAASPALRIYVGTADICVSYKLPINVFAIHKVVIAGVNSKSQINQDLIYTGTSGAANMGGFTWGAKGAHTAGFRGNIHGKEMLLLPVVDSAPDELKMYNYLYNKHKTDLDAQKFDNGKLVLTFDDIPRSGLNTGLPLLTVQGVKATFYVISDFVGTSTFLTWAELNTLYAAGMDLQCHTQTHTDLTTLTGAQVIAEFETVNAAFVANGLPIPTQLAYPFGNFNATVIGAMAGLRVTGRIVGGSDIPIYKNQDKFHLQCYNIDTIDDAGVIAFKILMDNAKLNKTALVTLAHGVDAGGTWISSAQLNSIIDYAQTIGMDIITMSQLNALMP